jgi:hypothetical protein
VNLHHQTVFQAHPGHFGEHLGAEEFCLLGKSASAGQNLAIERSGLGLGKVGGLGSGMAVVGRRAS